MASSVLSKMNQKSEGKKEEEKKDGVLCFESSKLTKKEGRREKRGETLRWNPLVV